MKIIDRIIIFIDSQNIKVSTFEKKSGLSNGYIKKISDSPGTEKIENILKAYPKLNRSWLLTGEGEMLKNEVEYGSEAIGSGSRETMKFISLLEKKDEQIDQLISIINRCYPSSNQSNDVLPRYENITNNNKK